MTCLAFLLRRRRLILRRTSLQQRVTLLHFLLPLPQLLPRVVFPAEVRREAGLANAAGRGRRGPRRYSRLVAMVGQPAPLALPEVHFTEVEWLRGRNDKFPHNVFIFYSLCY